MYLLQKLTQISVIIQPFNLIFRQDNYSDFFNVQNLK